MKCSIQHILIEIISFQIVSYQNGALPSIRQSLMVGSGPFFFKGLDPDPAFPLDRMRIRFNITTRILYQSCFKYEIQKFVGWRIFLEGQIRTRYFYRRSNPDAGFPEGYIWIRGRVNPDRIRNPAEKEGFTITL